MSLYYGLCVTLLSFLMTQGVLGGSSSAPVVLEGRFGRADVDVAAPSLVGLFLRGPMGLDGKSLLAPSGSFPWATRGYSYVVDDEGRRYSSYLARPEKWEIREEGGRKSLRLVGVKLLAEKDGVPLAEEDWTLTTSSDGAQLVWTIARRWMRDCHTTLSGTPGLFTHFDKSPGYDSSVTHTFWYDPLRVAAQPGLEYALCVPNWCYRPRAVSKNNLQTIKDRDTWAIYKLWTNWHAPLDLRLEVKGGYLYRRGAFALVGEAGAVTTLAPSQSHRRGDTEQVSLSLTGIDNRSTGHQLVVSLPDKKLETTLTGFYGSLLNGGTINDQKGYDFGNETDGFYYSGSSWAQALALAAGVPSSGSLSAHPYDAVQAFREHLAHIMSLLDDGGCDHFGYNHVGLYAETQLLTLLATRTYLVASGDLPFVRQHLPALESILGFFERGRGKQGLYELPPTGPHWYYDGVRTSGVSAYYNALFFKAACDLAEIEEALGNQDKASAYESLAESIRTAFNKALWRENAPGGPRYADWLDADGNEVTSFIDLCQWSAVGYGLASPEQARKIVATADTRLAELEACCGYQGTASLCALWPIPSKYTSDPWTTGYNGGFGLMPTYREIMGRLRAGDREGAYRRLSRFAKKAEQTSWVGQWFTMKGESGPSREPYLADMIVVPTALVDGFLGVRRTWKKLDVEPRLPAGWSQAEVEVLYKGRRHRISIKGDAVRVEPLEQDVHLPLLWLMDANLQQLAPGNVAKGQHIDYGDGGSLQLARQHDNRQVLARWKLDEVAGPVLDASSYAKHGTIQGAGVFRGEPGHNPEGKSARFDGHGWVKAGGAGGATIGPYHPRNDSLTFSPWESFTVQAWFKTESSGDETIVANAVEWGLCLQRGRLAAWISQDGGHKQQAMGSHQVADGKWHHAVAVFDRKTQRLSIYLDGKLDSPRGEPTEENPADISRISASKWPARVTLGSLDGQDAFVGSLEDVAIVAEALAPGHELEAVLASVEAKQPASPRHVASGSYLSPVCDWGVRARVTELTIATELNSGRVTAMIEVSDDGFRTVQSRTAIQVKEGVQAYPLRPELGIARAIRVRFDLSRGSDPGSSPLIDGFRVVGQPAD